MPRSPPSMGTPVVRGPTDCTTRTGPQPEATSIVGSQNRPCSGFGTSAYLGPRPSPSVRQRRPCPRARGGSAAIGRALSGACRGEYATPRLPRLALLSSRAIRRLPRVRGGCRRARQRAPDLVLMVPVDVILAARQGTRRSAIAIGRGAVKVAGSKRALRTFFRLP